MAMLRIRNKEVITTFSVVATKSQIFSLYFEPQSVLVVFLINFKFRRVASNVFFPG